MRRLAALVGIGAIVVFAVFLVRETAAVVALARDVHPVLAPVVLWTLVTVYAVCFLGPAVYFATLPRPLVPPAGGAPDELPRYLARLAARLRRNRALSGLEVSDTRESLEAAVKVLDRAADRVITREASLVFVSTALSQSGRLDALFVLVVQGRLIWKLARLYRQRPALRELLYLYGNVGATIFAAESLEDLDLAEVVEPMIPPLLEAAGVGATVVLAPMSTVLADSLLQGTVNSFLTFRTGCIAKRYCAGLPLPDRRSVRRTATREAASMLRGVVIDLAGTVASAVWQKARDVVANRTRLTVGRAASFVTGGPFGAALYEAVRKAADTRVFTRRGPADSPPLAQSGGEGA